MLPSTDFEFARLSEFVLGNTFFQSMLPSLPSIAFLASSREEFMTELGRMLKPSWGAFLSGQQEMLSPGRTMRRKGATAKYPIILIPGVISTGLEVWQGRACAEPYFRQRLWGTLTMLRMMILDKECWLEHMRLDEQTGGDPEGIRVRAAQGLEAADFMFPGIWVLGRIIENLAEVGYDSNSMYMAAYDWRVDIQEQQRRDHYYSKLKALIETVVATNGGTKVAIVTHSYGGLVAHNFMKWVEADPQESVEGHGGGGGNRWVDRHMHAIVNIATPYLGVAKSVSCIMSGEMRDTAQLGRFESFLVDKLLSKRERASLFRTWTGGFSMLPKGGTRIWGSEAESADGGAFPVAIFVGPGVASGKTDTSGDQVEQVQKIKLRNYSFDDIDHLMKLFLPASMYSRVHAQFSTGIARPDEIARNDIDYRTWFNPLESRLPHAPSLTIYSLYGVGLDTEKGYLYRAAEGSLVDDEDCVVVPKDQLNTADPRKMHLPFTLDRFPEDPFRSLYNGIFHVDGDGTVPLLSNAYMGAHAWRKYSHLNPAGVKSVVREYRHDPLPLVSDIRGGPAASDHVGILGNHRVIQDMIRVVCDFREPAEPSVAKEEVQSPNEKKGESSKRRRRVAVEDEPVLGDLIESNISEIGERIRLVDE